MSIISFPLLLNILGKSNQVALVENKAVTKWPEWPESISGVVSYQSELVDYLEDQFGGRSFMLKLLSGIKYNLFSESISKRVSVGQHGYVFMNSHDENDSNSLLFSVCKNEPPFPQTMNEITSAMDKLGHLAAQYQFKEQVLIVPTKSVIYPEYLPSEIQTECGINQQNWITSWARKHDKVNYPLDEFYRWKDDLDVYMPKRFHWIGALPYKVAQMITEHWGLNYNNELFTPRQKRIESDMQNHLYGINLSQDGIDYEMSESVTLCQTTSCLDGFKSHFSHGHIKVYTSNVNNKRLLLLSDSFGPFAAKYFSGGFGEVYATNLNNLKKSEEKQFYKWIIKSVQPTHLLYLIHDGGTVWQMKRLNRSL